MTILEQLAPRSRVAVVRLDSVRDSVLMTPGLALLKRTRPDLAIGVAIDAGLAPLLEGNPAVSATIIPSWQGVRRWTPSLCLNLHGSVNSQWITALSGARFRAGFTHHSTTFAYNVRIGRAQSILGVNRSVHTAEYIASAFFALGVPVQDVPPGELFAGGSVRTDRYAVLCPFRSDGGDCWPVDRFCEVARYLNLWHVTPIFLTAARGPAEDFHTFERFSGNLTQLKDLLSRAIVFVGHGGNAAEMAAGFRVPSVILSGASNPAIWGPWRTESEVIMSRDAFREVSVSRIIGALDRLRVFEEAHA